MKSLVKYVGNFHAELVMSPSFRRNVAFFVSIYDPSTAHPSSRMILGDQFVQSRENVSGGNTELFNIFVKVSKKCQIEYFCEILWYKIYSAVDLNIFVQFLS